MKAVDIAVLERWRSMDAVAILKRAAEYAKPDATFVPAKNVASTRWHATAGGHDFELLLTGPKFWDTREQRGGGGAIDLAMYLRRLSFKEAVAYLTEAGL